MAGLLERGVRLGELWVHDHRAMPRPRPGEQGERLGGASGREHLVGVEPVSEGERGLGPVGRRVAADLVEARAQRLVEPEWPRAGVDVDREVEQAGPAHLGVTVVAEGVGHFVGG